MEGFRNFQKVTSISDIQKGPQKRHLPHLGTSGRVASGRLGLYRVSNPEPARRTKDPAPKSQASSATPPHARPCGAGRR